MRGKYMPACVFALAMLLGLWAARDLRPGVRGYHVVFPVGTGRNFTLRQALARILGCILFWAWPRQAPTNGA